MLLAAEEYVLEYLSEAEGPESTAIAIAHLLATAASEASKQVPERLPLTVLISLAQMTGPLVRRLPQDMAQVGASQRAAALSSPCAPGNHSRAWLFQLLCNATGNEQALALRVREWTLIAACPMPSVCRRCWTWQP